MADEPIPKQGHDTATVHLAVFGQVRALSCEVRTGERTPVDLLLPARALTDHLTKASSDRAKSQGKSVSCERGCAACCRQLIPVSSVEASALADRVSAMPPAPREAVRARFEAAVKRMEAARLIDPEAPKGRQALLGDEEGATWDRVSRRYLELWIDCPFLEGEECSIYEDRPFACREYQVTTPPEWCRTLDPRLEATERPVWMSEAMAAAAHAIAGAPEASIPLALALEWAEARGQEVRAPRDGVEMFWTLLSMIDKQAKTPFKDRSASEGERPSGQRKPKGGRRTRR